MELTTYFIKPNSDYLHDLYFSFCGFSKNAPLHSFGPAKREEYIIHIIFEGKGTFKINGHTFFLQANQGFVIPPHVSSIYQADEEEPWSYCWLGFNGSLAKKYLDSMGIKDNSLTFQLKEVKSFAQIIRACMNYQEDTYVNELRLNALTYQFLADIIEKSTFDRNLIKRSNQSQHIEDILNYIHKNYSKKINLSVVAAEFHLNTSYLSRLFKKEMSQTVGEYIEEFRINRAAEMMTLSESTIKAISEESGFKNYVSFARAFKKLKGQSPNQYRKEHKADYYDNGIPDFVDEFLQNK